LDPLTFKAEGTKFLQKAGKIKHQRKGGGPQEIEIFKRKIPTAGKLKYLVKKKLLLFRIQDKRKFAMSAQKVIHRD
jgi:hypothetical protein